MRVQKGDEWKATFKTRYGHFEYVVLPLALPTHLLSFNIL
jgi:hypothetical protein